MTTERPSAGLGATLRRLADHGLELLHTRLALFGTEIELEIARVFDAVLRGAAALLLIGFGLLFAAAFVVALLWDSYRLPALAGVALVFGGAGLWLLRDARARLQQAGGCFGLSLGELARDREQIAPRD